MRLLRPLLTLTLAVLFLPALFQPVTVSAADPTPKPNQGQVDPGAKGQDTKGENIDPITGKKVNESSVIDYVNSAYQFLAVIGGLLAVLMLVYAGYRYMTSYGDPENIKDAKDIVEKALIGLGLLILAALILNTINPRTAQDPCAPGEANCGDIDFSKSDGGAQQIESQADKDAKDKDAKDKAQDKDKDKQ